MSETMNIYQRINSVMKECAYIQKERADKGVGVKYDTVIAMLRDLLIKRGIVTVMRQESLENVGAVGANQKIYQGKFEMDLVNMDDPKDLVTHSCFAQGMDGGDKGPGKAHTYAAKQMIVKAFNLETGIDEESRAEKIATQESAKTIITDERLQKAIIAINNGEFSLDRLHSGFKLTSEQVETLNKGLAWMAATK